VESAPGPDRGLRPHRGAAPGPPRGARVRREGAPPPRRAPRARGALPDRADPQARPARLHRPDDPERYGGSYVDVVSYGIICEELARIDWVVASVVSVTNSLVGARSCVTAARRRRRPGCRGWRAARSCPRRAHRAGGGTDLGNLKSTARKVDGGWRLDGTKVFISHAAHAGPVPRGRVDRPRQEAPRRHAFLVDPKSEGIGIGEFPMRTLKRDNLAEVHFENVFVPDSGLLGQAGGGFPVLGSALDMGRYSVAARCVGHRSAASTSRSPTPTAARPSAEDRRVPDDQQKLRHGLPHRGRARRGLPARAHEGRGRRAREPGGVAGEADGVGGRHLQRARRVQIHGGYGLSAEYEVGRLLLEAKALESARAPASCTAS